MHVRADLAALPAMLQRIDDWIADGVLGGDEPNAADYQIGHERAAADDPRRPATGDRGPARGRACDARSSPTIPGHAPPILPAEWLEPLRAATPA